jgi:hypothetical protein
MTNRIAALFITGGAGAAAWRLAFEELYGIPADIGEFTDTDMTDPDVGHKTFAAVLGHEPSRAELGKLMERRLHHLYQTVATPTTTGSLTVSRYCCPGCSKRDTCSGWSPATWRPPRTSCCTGPG